MRFGEVKMETRGGQHLFEIQIYFNDLDPKAARVELCANGLNGAVTERVEMKPVRPLAATSGGYVYGAGVPSVRPATDYTARVIPRFDGVAVPLEEARIRWQR